MGNAPEERGHHKLEAWKQSRKLVTDIYLLTKEFPKDEMYGLTLQIRRSAISIPSNIAEGAARTGNKEFAQFLSIARGSLSELETQLLIASDLGYVREDNPVFALVHRISRLLTGLHKTVRP